MKNRNLSTDEAAKLLGISPIAIQELFNKSSLKAEVQFNGGLKIREYDLMKMERESDLEQARHFWSECLRKEQQLKRKQLHCEYCGKAIPVPTLLIGVDFKPENVSIHCLNCSLYRLLQDDC